MLDRIPTNHLGVKRGSYHQRYKLLFHLLLLNSHFLAMGFHSLHLLLMRKELMIYSLWYCIHKQHCSIQLYDCCTHISWWFFLIHCFKRMCNQKSLNGEVSLLMVLKATKFHWLGQMHISNLKSRYHYRAHPPNIFWIYLQSEHVWIEHQACSLLH